MVFSQICKLWHCSPSHRFRGIPGHSRQKATESEADTSDHTTSYPSLQRKRTCIRRFGLGHTVILTVLLFNA